jgi:hypothetical protein
MESGELCPWLDEVRGGDGGEFLMPAATATLRADRID